MMHLIEWDCCFLFFVQLLNSNSNFVCNYLTILRNGCSGFGCCVAIIFISLCSQKFSLVVDLPRGTLFRQASNEREKIEREDKIK
jgi:hypothetical protein